MPERDSDPQSLELGQQVAARLGIPSAFEDIEPILVAAGCYRRRDQLIRRLVPEFGHGWGCKVAVENVLQKGAYTIGLLIVRAPDGGI